MIPILYTDGTLVGQGIGRLSDALSCVVVHEINGEYELEMTYPITGQFYSEIETLRFIFARPDQFTGLQPFRIYKITKPLNGVVTIKARHLSYDMSGIVVEPFEAPTLTEAVGLIVGHTVPTPCSFNFNSPRSVDSPFKVSAPKSLWECLGGSSGSFLDVYGGEWDLDGYTATLVTRLGSDRGVQVRYGKNLTKLEQTSDVEGTYCGVYPFYYDEDAGILVDLPEGYVSTPSNSTRIYILDCSMDFDTPPDADDLRARANAFITNNSVGLPKSSWKISFVELSKTSEFKDQALLEQVHLGDTVHVFYEALGVNASSRVVRTEFNVLADRYNSVTLGRVKQNLAAIIAGQNQEMQQTVQQIKSWTERAIDSATAQILHGGGVMRLIYSGGELVEIVSLDNGDITLAQSVWRWNNGGFGHSSNGYNGDYTTAITQDGAIVADFITAGTLTANVIKAGVLTDQMGTFWLDMETGEFRSKFSDEVYARLTFGPNGLKIQGTAGADPGAYVLLSATSQEFHVKDANDNDMIALELSGSGINTPALHADGDVAAATITLSPWQWYVDENGFLTLGRT